MQENDKVAAARWAEVHGELDASGQATLRRALQADPAMLASQRDTEALHHQLQALVPSLTLTPEALENEIMAAFDADTAAASKPAVAPAPAATPALFSVWSLLTSPRFERWSGALAAAAAIAFIVSGLPYYAARPLVWNQPEFAAMRVRGVAPAHTRADAATCLSALQRELDAADAGRQNVRTRYFGAQAAEWVLDFRFEAREAGTFTVIVEAGKPGLPSRHRWEQRSDSTLDFVNQANALARRISEDLHAD